jgi:hypothetical protein
MIGLTLQHDFADLNRQLDRISDAGKRAKATAMAFNKVAAKANTTAGREIRRHYMVKVAHVSPRIKVHKASGKSDAVRVVIEPVLGSRGRSQNVVRFLEKKVTLAEMKRRRKAGRLASVHYLRGRARVNPILHFQITKGRSKRIDGAFIGNKGRTVFRRTGSRRLPIEPIHTIDVPDMFGSRRVTEAVIARIQQELPVEISRAIRLVLSS